MSEEHKPVGKCYTCGKLLYATLGICRECELESELADAKTVIEELKGKFTTAGDSIGFLATDQNGKSVWVNCQNDIIEQLQAELTEAKKQIQLMHDNGLGESWVERFGLEKCKAELTEAKVKNKELAKIVRQCRQSTNRPEIMEMCDIALKENKDE